MITVMPWRNIGMSVVLLGVAACTTNQQAIGSDLRQAVPFYACNALSAARSIGNKAPPAGGGPVVSAPLPDAIQIQFQAATTTTGSAQVNGSTPAGTPVVIGGQVQVQRAFADTHQVSISYNTPSSVTALANECDKAPVVAPEPLQVTQTSQGIITAQKLQ
jgi:hypothetical protein